MEQKPEFELSGPSALELIQRAEIDMQIATANRFPRPDLSVIKKRMLAYATLDEETAESCFYSVPRDGKTIKGPSIRLAEITVACYGNLRIASRVLGHDGKVLTSQAACHDLENNVLQSVEVQRRITGKSGKTYSEDMIVTTGNAANSIARRNAIFSVIPGVLWKPVYDQARLVAVGNASTLVTKRDKMIKRLNSMEVMTPRILARLGRSSVEDITLEDLEVLIGAGTAIKDGDTSVDDAFPSVVATQGAGFTQPKPADVKTETPEQREARQEEKIRQQSEPEVQSSGAPPSDPPKKEVAQGIPEGNWPTRDAMMAAFEALAVILTGDVVDKVLANNGIGSTDDMSMIDKATIEAFNNLQDLAKAKQAADNPKPVTAGRFSRRTQA